MSQRNNEFLEEFIEIYKNEPSLWKVKADVYHNRDIRDAAYRKLVTKLKEIEPDANENMVKKKINTLRTNIRREQKKIESSMKSGASDGSSCNSMHKIKGSLYEVEVGDECHTLLETSVEVGENEETSRAQKTKSIFNLAMIDVSGSMCSYWNPIMDSCNNHISPQLKGNTKIYVFGSDVYFRRNETRLENDDFFSEGTNLTEAIKVINTLVTDCQEKIIRVFLFTDGHHNDTDISPSIEIEKLTALTGKTVEVFLLGLGYSFPVDYSITIRSALHNGNSNVPALFWAKNDGPEDIEASITAEIMSIADILKSNNVKLNLSRPGYLAPGFSETDTVHGGEFVYFPCSPNEISLKLSVVDEPSTHFELSASVQKIDLQDLLNGVFRQWNSLIIQHHRQKGKVLSTSFDVMEAIYKKFYEKLLSDLETIENNSIRYRLARKQVKYIENEFATLMNQSKAIIGLENKYSSEIELAENILKTTVKSKYFHKTLKMKGHSTEDYEADIKQFSEIYEKNIDDIMAVPQPSPDDCCRVTMRSMLTDLQDPCLPDLLKEDKFTFLKTFTVNGLPIYAPVKDSSQINPWSLHIKNILNSPFSIVSQSTLELTAEVGTMSMNSENKDVFLQENDENTRFNAIIPVFTPEVANVLKPLIQSNIFAMLATFCILKDPHIIDHNAHLAALGCAWMKVIMDYPSIADRPQFITERLCLIETTAKIYLGRKGIAKYLMVLLSDPNQALMTESTIEYGEKTLKCESLIKPMFLLYLARDDNISSEKLLTILHLLVLEYIGRCMTNYSKADSSNECLYSHLFVPVLYSRENRKEWFEKKTKETCTKILEAFKRSLGGSLTENFFILEDLHDSLKAFSQEHFKQIGDFMFDLAVNQKVIHGLRSESTTGNIRLPSIQIFAQEMAISEENCKSLFDEEKLFVYLLHSLKNKSSRERLSESLPSYDEAFEEVKKQVASENSKTFKNEALKQILKDGEKMWSDEFLSIHDNQFVKPMTRGQIKEVASSKGVPVTDDNFKKIFRYNPKTGVLRNTCMNKSCPYYLKPNKSFNQHIYRARKDNYIHQLHHISMKKAATGGTAEDVINAILEGYRSMNGLKVPPTPSKDYVSSKKESIEQLIQDYKSFLEKEM